MGEGPEEDPAIPERSMGMLRQKRPKMEYKKRTGRGSRCLVQDVQKKTPHVA